MSRRYGWAPGLALGLILLGCGAIEDEPPSRNPLAETASPVTVTSTAAPQGTAAPTVTATARPGGAPVGSAQEAATARAIEAMAEWLGVPQRELAVRLVEVVEWPDACLGVRQPVACAQVVTPGYRIRLEDALGTMHSVHTDATASQLRWAGDVVGRGTVTSVDANARRVTVQIDGRTLTLRLAPGTTWTPDDGERNAAGRRVAVGYDPAATTTMPGTAAWIVIDPP